MLEIFLHRFIVAMIVGIGVALGAASLEPPTGAKKQGYSVNPLLAGGSGAMIMFGMLMGRQRKIRRKKKPKGENEDEGLGKP